MLPPFIIDQIREREEREREEREREQPRLDLPVYGPPRRAPVEDVSDRGIVEIQIW